MERHLYIHNKKYCHKSDLFVLFTMLFIVIGVLAFLTVIIPEGALADDIPYNMSQLP